MSIFSDHDCGAMSDHEYREECKRMNRKERCETVRFYDPVRLTDDYDDEEEYEDEDI